MSASQALTLTRMVQMTESDFMYDTLAHGRDDRHTGRAATGADEADRLYLINVARGAGVDQRALNLGLSERKIAGAALAVFVKELLPPDVVNPEVLTRPGFRAKMARHAACGRRLGSSGQENATPDESP